MSDFREIVKLRPFLKVRKNFTILKFRQVVYHFEARAGKHVIWRITKYSLFEEIFKYPENMNNNRFREIHKSSLKIARFEYFAKEIIYSQSPDRASK